LKGAPVPTVKCTIGRQHLRLNTLEERQLVDEFEGAVALPMLDYGADLGLTNAARRTRQGRRIGGVEVDASDDRLRSACRLGDGARRLDEHATAQGIHHYRREAPQLPWQSAKTQT